MRTQLFSMHETIPWLVVSGVAISRLACLPEGTLPHYVKVRGIQFIIAVCSIMWITYSACLERTDFASLAVANLLLLGPIIAMITARVDFLFWISLIVLGRELINTSAGGFPESALEP